MYNFVDTNGRELTKPLPSEALQINGEYIEDLIDGYRTLYVKGRETLSPDVEFDEVGVRDGSYLKNKRFPQRKLTVGYQIFTQSNADFIEAFSALNDILNVENAELIFADETDKFLIGTPTGFGSIPTGTNNVKGEFEIICSDPFKYSVQEYEVTPTADDGATMVVDYDGTYPTYPVLKTEFYQSDTTDDAHGECGFVAFVNDRGNVIQMGEVTEPDTIAVEVQNLVDSTTDTWTESKTMLNEQFNSLTGWTINNGFTTMPNYVKTGTAQASVFPSGADKAARANSYGSTSNTQYHGVTIMKTLGSDGGSPAKTGATDWRFHATIRFCANKNADTAKKERGAMQCFLLDNSGAFVAGVSIWKNGGGTKGSVRLYVRGTGTVKTWDNVDMSHYNARFGVKKTSTDKRPCNIDITKSGAKFTFNVGGLTFSYNQASLTNVVVNKISYYFAQWASAPAVSFNGVYSCVFTSDSVTKTKTTETWETLTQILEVKNTFNTNDLLIADCNDGSIRLTNSLLTEGQDGGLRSDLGALGNDWEQFTLEKGLNQITTVYSDWVADAYKPSFSLTYRKRYL